MVEPRKIQIVRLYYYIIIILLYHYYIIICYLYNYTLFIIDYFYSNIHLISSVFTRSVEPRKIQVVRLVVGACC
eukprot:SAG11_NODE_85_length_17370_cov_29.272017_1_plen_73_part_10